MWLLLTTETSVAIGDGLAQFSRPFHAIFEYVRQFMASLTFQLTFWTKTKNLIYTHQMAKQRCRSLNRIPLQAIQWKWARQARWDSIGNCPFLLDVTPLSFIFSIDFRASIGTRLHVCSCLLFAEIINLFCVRKYHNFKDIYDTSRHIFESISTSIL